MGYRHVLRATALAAFLHGCYAAPKVGWRDTALPNALVVLPASDANGAFSPTTPNNSMLLDTLRQQYDVRVVRVGTDRALYTELDRTPDISLLIIAGHDYAGAGQSFALDRADDWIAQGQKFLDVMDGELASHVRTLRPDATIFLYACGAGKGGRDASNLANRVRDLTGARTIAALDTFDALSLDVRRARPFDVSIAQRYNPRSGAFYESPHELVYVASAR